MPITTNKSLPSEDRRSRLVLFHKKQKKRNAQAQDKRVHEDMRRNMAEAAERRYVQTLSTGTKKVAITHPDSRFAPIDIQHTTLIHRRTHPHT